MEEGLVVRSVGDDRKVRRYSLKGGRKTADWVRDVRERGWEGLQRILGNGCGPSGTPRLTLRLFFINLCCFLRGLFGVLRLCKANRALVQSFTWMLYLDDPLKAMGRVIGKTSRGTGHQALRCQVVLVVVVSVSW